MVRCSSQSGRLGLQFSGYTQMIPIHTRKYKPVGVNLLWMAQIIWTGGNDGVYEYPDAGGGLSGVSVMTNEQFLTVGEVAERIRVSEEAVRNWLRKG